MSCPLTDKPGAAVDAVSCVQQAHFQLLEMETCIEIVLLKTRTEASVAQFFLIKNAGPKDGILRKRGHLFWHTRARTGGLFGAARQGKKRCWPLANKKLKNESLPCSDAIGWGWSLRGYVLGGIVPC